MSTGVLVLFGFAEVAFLWPYIDAQHAIGTDLVFYRQVAQHWLDTGQLYLPHQLAGPYVVTPDVDVLYPPTALVLFLPWIWMPAILWWVIPLGTIAILVWRLRPASWTWPLIALALVWPPVLSGEIYGNSDMWMAAGIGLGLRWGWPSLIASIKPSLGFLALIGANRRAWWVAAAGLFVVSLFALPLWLDYAKVVTNSGPQFLYSLYKIPGLMTPLIAWVGRRPGGIEWGHALRRPTNGGRVAVPR